MFAGSTYERIVLLLVAGLQTFSHFAGEASVRIARTRNLRSVAVAFLKYMQASLLARSPRSVARKRQSKGGEA